MAYNHSIVEIAPRKYVLARQNVASEVWSCGEMRSYSCLGAAQMAAKNGLTTVYPAVECATRALFNLYPDEEITGNITFTSAVDAKAQKKDPPTVVRLASSDGPLCRESASSKLQY